MYNWIFSIFVRLLLYRLVEKFYLKSGKAFVDLHVLNSFSIARKDDLDRTLVDWARWELEYSRRGYRTIPLDEFIDMGGYGGHIHKEDLKARRREGEKPILHAS